tara:strand:- start:583 stop:927 length:345 start_codon:yes stop_codon:yes gene_type:complete
MIKDLVQGAVKGAAVWVGNTIGGPTGAAIGSRIADSLMTKKAGGGEFGIMDTSVTPPSLRASMMGFRSPGRAGMASTRGMTGGPKTVDADTLTAEWNYRLKRYLVDMRYFSRKS